MREACKYRLAGPSILAVLAACLVLGSTGCRAQTIAADQQLVNFGDVASGGTSKTQTVTFINEGLYVAYLTEVSISPGGQFTVTGGTCETLAGPLPTGGSCTFTVQAIPTVTGPVSAVLAVTANNQNAEVFNSQPVSLVANGVTLSLILSPSVVHFDNVVVGTTSPPQVLSLYNPGPVPATISGATISIQPTGLGYPDVTISKDSNCYNRDTLAPYTACFYTITATPTLAGIITTQQFLLQGPAGSGYAPVSSSLIVSSVDSAVNGAAITLPPSPARSPAPSSPKRPSPPRRHQHLRNFAK